MKIAEVAHVTGTKFNEFKTIDGNCGATFDALCIRDGGIMSSPVAFADTKKEAKRLLAERVSNVTVMTSRDGVRQNFPLPKVTV